MQDGFGVLLMFVGAAAGSLVQDPVVCRFTESNQCYVALGRRLHLQMPLKDEDGFDLKITDKTSNTRFILKYRKTYSNPPKPNSPRWQFDIKNKTMILTSAERSDSGTYTLDIFDANGNNKGNYNLQLNIEGVTRAFLSTLSVLLVVLSVLALYIFKKRQDLRNKEDPAQDEITEYATVATSPCQSNPKKKEDEVQYSQLVFNTPAPQNE